MSIPQELSSQDHPPTSNHFIRNLKIMFYMIVFCGFVYVLVVGMRGLDPGPDLGKLQPLRELYILADQTDSLTSHQRETVKDLLKSVVLPSLGPGDKVYAYRIDSQFGEGEDRIFLSEESLARAWDNLPTILWQHLKPSQAAEMTDVWHDFEQGRARWFSEIEKVTAGQGDTSDYLGAIRQVEGLVKQSDSVAVERILLILGDLKHEDHAKGASDQAKEDVTQDPEDPRVKRLYRGFTVILAYPGEQDAIRDEWIEHWRSYFANRGGSEVQWNTFDGLERSLPKSKIPYPPDSRLREGPAGATS